MCRIVSYRFVSYRLVSSRPVSSRVVPFRPVSSRRISSCFVSPRLMSYGIVAWHSACAYSRVYLLSSVCNLRGVVASQSKARAKPVRDVYIHTYLHICVLYTRTHVLQFRIVAVAFLWFVFFRIGIVSSRIRGLFVHAQCTF